jgi:uncharacterized membrane protein YGL010W
MQPSKPRLIDYIMITPDAQTRIFDLRYQVELYEIFHGTRLSRTLHALCTPVITWSLFVLATLIPLRGPALMAALPAATLNGAFGLMGVLLLWYLRLDALVTLIAAPILVAMWITSSLFSAALGGAAGWYGLGLLVVGSTIQDFSHAVEPLPPPLSGSGHFGKGKSILAEMPLKMRIYTLIGGLSIFAFLELISSPRIFAVQILNSLRRFGYKKDFYEKVTATAREVLRGDRLLSTL